eukprot:NODE_620_length_2883_cov_2.475689.p1 GENE.NODE_620_length_2883_cov_2.475689~~NODE_620_length_2883_cov_2.475689.p1  ORF type:complete len:833 (+),score=312.93 NODE_620_length_2883_cov_2.475689:311-2809(+)
MEKIVAQEREDSEMRLSHVAERERHGATERAQAALNVKIEDALARERAVATRRAAQEREDARLSQAMEYADAAERIVSERVETALAKERLVFRDQMEVHDTANRQRLEMTLAEEKRLMMERAEATVVTGRTEMQEHLETVISRERDLARASSDEARAAENRMANMRAEAMSRDEHTEARLRFESRCVVQSQQTAEQVVSKATMQAARMSELETEVHQLRLARQRTEAALTVQRACFSAKSKLPGHGSTEGTLADVDQAGVMLIADHIMRHAEAITELEEENNELGEELRVTRFELERTQREHASESRLLEDKVHRREASLRSTVLELEASLGRPVAGMLDGIGAQPATKTTAPPQLAPAYAELLRCLQEHVRTLERSVMEDEAAERSGGVAAALPAESSTISRAQARLEEARQLQAELNLELEEELHASRTQLSTLGPVYNAAGAGLSPVRPLHAVAGGWGASETFAVPEESSIRSLRSIRSVSVDANDATSGSLRQLQEMEGQVAQLKSEWQAGLQAAEAQHLDELDSAAIKISSMRAEWEAGLRAAEDRHMVSLEEQMAGHEVDFEAMQNELAYTQRALTLECDVAAQLKARQVMEMSTCEELQVECVRLRSIEAVVLESRSEEHMQAEYARQQHQHQHQQQQRQATGLFTRDPRRDEELEQLQRGLALTTYRLTVSAKEAVQLRWGLELQKQRELECRQHFNEEHWRDLGKVYAEQLEEAERRVEEQVSTNWQMTGAPHVPPGEDGATVDVTGLDPLLERAQEVVYELSALRRRSAAKLNALHQAAEQVKTDHQRDWAELEAAHNENLQRMDETAEQRGYDLQRFGCSP